MATIPGAENAFVGRSKLTDYLLSRSHPDGRSKAEFLSRFGLTVEGSVVPIAALLEIAPGDDIVETVESRFGKRRIGRITAPYAEIDLKSRPAVVRSR